MIVDKQVPRRYVRRVAHMNGLVAHYQHGEERVMLFALGTRYSVGRQGQGKNACVHGYAAVIETILRRYPLAHIETMLTVYTGLHDFLARREETQMQIGGHKRFGRQSCMCGMGATRQSTLPETSPREASRG